MSDNVILRADGWWYDAQTGERIGKARLENVEPDILKSWNVNQQGNLWRVDPDHTALRWHVSKRNNGWVWYTVDYSASTTGVTTGITFSRDFGPFASWEAAAADCETAHKHDA